LKLGEEFMKLTELWRTREKPSLSFELFPARSEKGDKNLRKVIDKLANLHPDFVSVTFGAGGSTRSGSRQLLEKLKHEKGLEVLVPHPKSLPHATDLVAFVRPRYDYCLGVAGYPEGHIDAASKEKDLAYLKMKIDLGAEFIITNYFYDNKFFFDFVERCRAAEIFVPIIPGIMPIYSVRMMEMLAGMCGATIVEELQSGIAALPEGDTAALTAFGIEFASRQCVELIESGVPGLHIYTMDRSPSVVGLVNRLRDTGLL
jgi:methylenetetrahydrofolate reductase (NADPH)